MVTHCRICDSTELFKFLNLGFTPPADQFLRPDQLKEAETHYPLEVLMCRGCGLPQLSYVVPGEILYKRDYPYESSITKSGQKHWDEFAETVFRSYRLKNDDLVVDIGSNVGVLLESFKKLGLNTLGIDPASNIVRIAEKRGIETWDEFFIPDVAKLILEKKGFAKVITATNVFAHVDDLKSFMQSVQVLLDDKGIFIFEAPYFGNLINFLEYDTIYHEHLSYLLLEPVMQLVKKFRLEIIDVQERDIHGGSFRVFVAREGQYKIHDRVAKFLEREQNEQWRDEKKLKKFANRVHQNRQELVSLLHDLKQKGCKLAAVSAPAKGMTLLNYCRIGTDTLTFITEKSNLKIGRLCPGVHIPVVADSELVKHHIDYALLLAWNFSDEIMGNLQEYKANGGKFIIPIPKPRII